MFDTNYKDLLRNGVMFLYARIKIIHWYIWF